VSRPAEGNDRVLTQRALVLDASAALVLFASGRMHEILRAQSASVWVVQETVDEVRFLRGSKTSKSPSEHEQIDWSSVLSPGLMGLLERTDPQEFARFVHLAQMVDEGEAAAAAAAMHRGYDLVVDDLKARRVFAGGVPLIWSLELVHHWCTSAGIPGDEVGAILANIRQKARYQPHVAHPLLNWWQRHYASE